MPGEGGLGNLRARLAAVETGGAQGSGGAAEAATITLPGQLQYYEQTVTRAGTLATQSARVWLAPAADTDDNSSEWLEGFNIDAMCEAGQVRFIWRSAFYESGAIKLKFEVN